MPKRKRDSDIEKLSKKFRRLERKLKRARRQRSSSREDSVLSVHNNEATENLASNGCNADKSRLVSVDKAPNESGEQRALSIEASSSRAHSLEPPSQALLPSQSPAVPLPPLQDTESCPVGKPSTVIDLTTSVVTTNDVSNTADDDVIDILGDDPTQATEFGKAIHDGLANRLGHIIINGLDNDTRKELCKKHLIPANCPRMVPPMLNAEIKAALPEASTKRDKGIENRQKQLANALACISDVIATKMNEKDKESVLLKQLMDAAKLMCHALHSDSVKRRYFALSTLKKDINDHLMQTKIDKYLFGETLAETLKSAKAVTKSGADIKVSYDKNKKTHQPQPSTSRGLNWKAPPLTGRQSGPQRSRQTFPPAAARLAPPAIRAPPPLHASSLRTSRYQPRPTRRH